MNYLQGLDANGRPLLELHFRVQFYVESPLMLRDETSRHNYYLQLKANAISRELPKECSEQLLLILGGLALQADFGDSPEDQTTDYIRTEEYIPNHLRSTWGLTALQSCHRDYRGMSRADAETHFIREACIQNDIINAHFFRMKMNKNETGCGSVWLIVYSRGIKILSDKSQSTTFQWPSISKLTFERKKFEIRSHDNRITLYSLSDEKNKMILALCRETHQFSMKMASRLTEAIKREEEESSCIHSCYMYSRSLNLPYKNKSDQRISVISSTSSNTTSGIVSDRVHSEDELEIMINSPPAIPIAAPSTESLALAHLLDRPSVSRQTSSVGQVSLKDLEDTLAALSVRSNIRSGNSGVSTTESIEHKRDSIESDSPNSQHNKGSQCSSTCSTVVTETETTQHTSLGLHSTSLVRRQISTSSSLELGFSHTPQNSALSDSNSNGIDPTYGSTTADEESTSGVYTLTHAPPTETSGIYTMNSSEMTGESSEMAESEDHESSHYGSFQPKSEVDESVETLDSIDGVGFRHRLGSDVNEFRLRSDSNVSASGSFRGDGSDPTDNKHNLLSANELTDLIVGRGTYPSRKTVSNTIDSDCDYVTLPLPLEGDSYIQGHEDTAPTEEEYEKDLMRPPTPPVRVDSTSHSSLSNIVDIRQCSPPPYNARHEKTGLSGPPLPLNRMLMDPPPYPTQASRPASVLPVTIVTPPTPSVSVPATVVSEEAGARFITTRPQINILKAHTSVVGEATKPSYAAPTIANITSSQIPIPNTIGIPLVPYNIHTAHKSLSTNVPSPQPAYPEVKSPPRTCVLLPVIKPRQYLPPPPPTLPRQPPPPPPPQLATVYTSQLARSQIELYQQQLYSDVDYVIYPIQDPAVSQQEYLDAKQGSILAAMAQNPPPPSYLFHAGAHSNVGWDTCKGHAIYRSTPYLSMAIPHSRYASTQNLSDTYVQLPGAYSPLYSPSVASLCSSYEAPPPPPFQPSPITQPATIFARSRSDDNILNSIETTPRHKRLPPPPPKRYEVNRSVKPPIPTPLEKQPPPIPQKSPQAVATAKLFALSSPSLSNTTSHIKQLAVPSKIDMPIIPNNSIIPNATTTNMTTTPTTNPSIDILALREKSRHLDLPLIAALCNDRSLIKQTKAFGLPKHPRSSLGMSPLSNGNVMSLNQKSKYPVSGLNTAQQQLIKPRKNASMSHRHPSDKLPPLPCQQTAEGNNYVMDPTPASIKHKSFNSQPSV